MKKPALWLSSISMILFFCSQSFAAHPLVTDDTGTQGKGKFQFELNGSYGRNKDNGVATKTTQISTALTYGLSDTADIVFTLPYEHIKKEDSGVVTKGDGISDISFEIKWRFYEKDGLSFGFKPGFALPTGDEGKWLGACKAAYHISHGHSFSTSVISGMKTKSKKIRTSGTFPSPRRLT